jgi:DNA repair exonuclease SbcCD nuclease subunit
MKTEILQISDTHLGKCQYRSELRQQDYLDAFEEAIHIAIEDDVDAVIHTGDLFDDSSPSVPTVNQTIDIMRDLADAQIPFYGIVGNHERKRDDQWLDLMKRFDFVSRLSTDPSIVGDVPEVAVYGIDAVRKPSWETTSFALTDSSAEFSVVCMHELLSPLVPAHMVEHSIEDVIPRFEHDIDAIALGDYHRYTSTTVNGISTWYPGSTEKTSRSEGDIHHVLKLQFEPDQNSFEKELIALSSPRPFIEIDKPVPADADLQFFKTLIQRYDFTGDNGKQAVAIFHLNGTDTGVNAKDIHRLLDDQGAAITQVIDNRSVTQTNTTDVKTVTHTDVESLLDDTVAELAFTDTTTTLEEVVRDLDIPSSHMRNKTEEILQDKMSIEK